MSDPIRTESVSADHLAKIAHDFKTPISIVMSAVSMIRLYPNRSSAEQDTLQKYLRYIDQNCHRLLRLVQALQDSASPEPDALPFHPSPCDLIPLVKNVLEQVQVYADQRNLEISFHYGSDSPAILSCDRDQVERILLNLLSNAVKHTPSGGTILVTLKMDEDYMYLSVIDDGEGIDPSFLPHIFDARATAPSSLKQTEPAVGLGLSIVRELAHMHKGTVNVASTPGRGSCFVVSLSRHLN